MCHTWHFCTQKRYNLGQNHWDHPS
jgi:hypothetical protein